MKLPFLRGKQGAFATDQSGGIAVAAGLLLPLMLAATAIAVDLGQAYLDRRTAQSIVDLAAINAANNMNIAEEAARATLTANGYVRLEELEVIKGHYTPDAALAPSQRFTRGLQPFNAVQVNLSQRVKLNFAATFVSHPLKLSVSAIAQDPAQASFSVGSRLLAVRGGIANQVLRALLGTNVSLTAMDYEALANADVRIDNLLQSINGSADLHAATFEDVLKANVTVSDVLTGAANVLSGNHHDAAVLLSSIALSTPKSLRIPLTNLINVGSLGAAGIGSENAALDAKLGVLDLLQSTALIANGQSQINLSLNLGVPGVSKLSATVIVGQRPAQTAWVSVGSSGSTVTTTQTRVRLVAEIGGTGLLAGTTIRLPLYIELASARATLDEVACADGVSEKSATVSVLPGVGRVAIAELSDLDFERPPPSLAVGNIVRTSLFSITASAEVSIQNADPADLTFTSEDVDNAVIKRSSTHSLTEALASSLLGSADIRIKALGVSSPLVTKNSVLNILSPVAGALDPILFELFDALGVKVGEADVRVRGIKCGNSNLAG